MGGGLTSGCSKKNDKPIGSIMFEAFIIGSETKTFTQCCRDGKVVSPDTGNSHRRSDSWHSGSQGSLENQKSKTLTKEEVRCKEELSHNLESKLHPKTKFFPEEN